MDFYWKPILHYTLMPMPQILRIIPWISLSFVSTHRQVWSDARHADQPLGLEWNATLDIIGHNLSFEQ